MFTALILMCTIDNYCYTITNETGFYTSETQCKEAIYALINDENFSTMYRYYEEGATYDIVDMRCINWGEKQT